MTETQISKSRFATMLPRSNFGTGLFDIVEMNMQAQYHVTREGPSEPHWPDGSWSVYRINGDQIADRVVREKVVTPTDGPAYYEGKVIARHSWCGYLGMTKTFDGVRELIEKDQLQWDDQMKRCKDA